uniref:Uncharacterized protein n=1 Tax=Anguilla anguilla TaxID=7936 RepID=A0A0E9RLF0_ANGAN
MQSGRLQLRHCLVRILSEPLTLQQLQRTCWGLISFSVSFLR